MPDEPPLSILCQTNKEANASSIEGSREISANKEEGISKSQRSDAESPTQEIESSNLFAQEKGALQELSEGPTTPTLSHPVVSNEILAKKRRPKPGERKLQILQALAEMLEVPRSDRVTTAALAARIQVSEAALYRHFASKAQMYEGLIEFIEESIFGLVNKITSQEKDGLKQIASIIHVSISFAEQNPGMTRVLIGDALVNEHERLQARINQLIARLELSIKQSVRLAIAQQDEPEIADPSSQANLIITYILGRWLRYAKSGFKNLPSEYLDRHLESPFWTTGSR